MFNEVYEYNPVSDLMPSKRRKGGRYTDNTEGNNITNFDPLYLLDRFFPLRKSTLNKFFNRCNNFISSEDLAAQIDVEFLDLVRLYDKTRGIDFPFYIGKMLHYRMWNFTDRITKSSSMEIPMEDIVDGHIESRSEEKPEVVSLPDEDSSFVLDIVDALNSVDKEVFEVPLNEILIKGVLSEGKSLEDLSEELDIPIKILNKHFNDLCEELRVRAIKNNEKAERLEKFENEADNIFKSLREKPSLIRQPIKRVPIMDDESWDNIDWDSLENPDI